jgi:very-short-patch-repair endonuclease
VFERDPEDTIDRRIRTRATARELRQRRTDTEQMLLEVVRRRQIRGLQFRQQHPIGPYVVDFVCYSARLVVEIDGAVHEEQQEYDAERDDYLQQMGYTVLRCSVDRILNDIDGVLSEIKTACVSPPLPRAGEGVTHNVRKDR